MPQRYDFVSVDSFEGGKLAGETLRAAGCERICYVGRIPPDLPEQAYDMASTQRLAGFEAGLGYKLDDSVKLGCDFYQTAPGAQVVAEYLALHPRPDGVFAASDEIAVGFVHGAWAHGLQPGEDYQIIGFDGQQIGRVIGGGSLTTIDAPMVEMGEMAAMMLMDRMQNPRRGVRQILHMGTVYHGVTVHQPNAEPVELPT